MWHDLASVQGAQSFWSSVTQVVADALMANTKKLVIAAVQARGMFKLAKAVFQLLDFGNKPGNDAVMMGPKAKPCFAVSPTAPAATYQPGTQLGGRCFSRAFVACFLVPGFSFGA